MIKRLLIISPEYPYPQKCGFSVRVGDLCRHLARSITPDIFICGKLANPDTLPLPGREFFRNVFFAENNGVGADLSLARRITRRILPPHFDDATYLPNEIVEQLAVIHARERYDACMIHTLLLARCLQMFPENVFKIIEPQDIWHQKYLAFKQLGQGKLLAQYRDQGRELALYRSVDLVLAISHWDHEYLQAHGVNSIYTPVSFEPNPLPGKAPAGTDLLYASGSGLFNVDALHYFIRKIMPVIQQKIPEVSLKIANASPEIIERYSGNPHIQLLPFQENVGNIYRQADLVIAPLRFTSGLKIKVIESFAFAKPIILSPAAAQGIPIDKYAQRIVSIEPEAFANEVVAALNDREYGKALVDSGMKMILGEYNPKKAYRELDRCLSQYRSSL